MANKEAMNLSQEKMTLRYPMQSQYLIFCVYMFFEVVVI